jgi:16S rRNA C967 or C1407 C5-methylase (RsmB/RsmF family)
LRVTNHDGSRWGLHEKGVYDLVMVDAPCSGERHLLESEKDMAVWSIARSRGLAHRQHALLCAALDAARVGRRIVYSTCALATNENDGVIQYFLKKRGDRAKVIRPALPAADDLALHPETTEFGWQIMPDTSGGAGPMYCCAIEKRV